MDRVDTAIFIETKIQKYIKDMNKIHDHSTVMKYMDKAARLYDILKDMGFKHSYRKINGKVAEVLIDVKENKFYKL